MTKNKQQNTRIEKILTRAGIGLVILGCLASIFAVSTNMRFIHDVFPSSIYYVTNALLLGGGFLAGYLLTRKASGKQARLFNGVAYAFVAFALYFIVDMLRFLTSFTIGNLEYPGEAILFQGSPLLALAITAALAFFTQYQTKNTEVSTVSKWTLITAFVAYQLYAIGTSVYYIATVPQATDAYSAPVLLLVTGYLVNSFLIAVVAFLALSKVKILSQRLFYAAAIGGFSQSLMMVLWDFRTDAALASTQIFEIFIYSIVLIVSTLLILKSRAASK